MAAKKKRMGCGKVFLALVVGVVVIVAVVLAVTAPDRGQDQMYGKTPQAERALLYFNELKEIKWVEIDGNNAYIRFDPLPSDWQMVISGAAFSANIAADFHVWAVRASEPGWRPGDSPHYGEVTVLKRSKWQ
jgi:hypothetical protein